MLTPWNDPELGCWPQGNSFAPALTSLFICQAHGGFRRRKAFPAWLRCVWRGRDTCPESASWGCLWSLMATLWHFQALFWAEPNALTSWPSMPKFVQRRQRPHKRCPCESLSYTLRSLCYLSALGLSVARCLRHWSSDHSSRTSTQGACTGLNFPIGQCRHTPAPCPRFRALLQVQTPIRCKVS